MPPKTARAQPTAAEVAVLRAWVAAGAQGRHRQHAPSPCPRSSRTTLKPAPVAALAYRHGDKPLAAGGQNEVVLIDPGTGEVTGRLTGRTAR